MKNFIVGLLFVPILLFAGVVASIVQKTSSAPSAFSLDKFPMPSVGEMPESEDPQVVSGWKVYNSKGCVYCHGPAGEGGVKNPGAIGGLIPKLTHVGEGYSAEELKERIRKGVKSEDIGIDEDATSPPPLYMPEWGDQLTKQEYDDLVVYLMSLLPEGADDDWD